MASCKDCIHFEVCNSRFPDPNNERLICEQFKDRSRFVELPCKVGDTIYEIVERRVSGKWVPKIVSRVVEQIEVAHNYIGFKCGTTIRVPDNLAFYTPEEAEQALKEREENA